MKENTALVIERNLLDRITTMKKYLKLAEGCLADSDYLQCAVRLQKAAEQARFDEMLLSIYDSMGSK